MRKAWWLGGVVVLAAASVAGAYVATQGGDKKKPWGKDGDDKPQVTL
jgi:hypothetical protein